MTERRISQAAYRVFSRLLAAKGSAEPLPQDGDGLILSPDDGTEPADDAQLADAVAAATHEALALPPRKRDGAAARLTELFDPALVVVARPRPSGSPDD